MVSLDLLADNMVPEPLVEYLVARGHRVFRVRDILGQDADDGLIAAYANERRLIVLTWNRKHFRKLADEARNERRKNRRNWGLIVLDCGSTTETAIDVLEEWDEYITMAYERAARKHPACLLLYIQLSPTSVFTKF